jgi:serine/threonine-protein kinase
MLAGRRAFDGETSSDAVAAVLSEEPDWARMPAGTPVGVRRLLTRCLQKEPEKRLRDAGDALLELEADDGPPEVARSRVGAVGWLAGAAALVGAALVGALWPREIAPVMPAAPVMFTVPTEGPLWTHTLAPCLALTQDGRTLVYAADDGSGRPELYVRRMDSFETTAMPGTKSGCAPFISPDGKWVGYLELVRDPALTVIAVRRVPLAGGPTEEVVARGMVTGASWGDDGSLVYSVMPGTLYRVVAGGEPVLLEPSVDAAKEVHHQPEVLPGSRQVLFTAWIKEGKDWKARLEAIDLSSGKRKVIAPEGSQARYASGSKELVFQKAGVVVAAPFDPAAAALTGEATRVVGLSGREPVTGSAGSYARFTVSGTGMLAYLPGSPPMEASDLAWFGVDGSVTTVMQGDIGVRSLRVSPDGGRVAFTTNPPVTDLRVLDLERKTTIRIATAAAAFSPVWTPDGARIAFEQHGVTHDGSQIAWAAADGSGLPEVLYTSPAGGICFPSAFLPDGKSLVIAVVGAEDNTDLFLLRVDGDRALTRMFGTPADRVAARFSPDATMIAYASTDLGRSEVYVHPYPALDRRLCLSTEGGERPCWSGDGRRLFFRFRDKIFVVDVSPPPAFEFGQARMLLEKLPGDRYDVSPDGTKFIMARPRGGWGPETSIHVVMGALGGGN